eukprot:351683-Chlamydomonas_euryale.AAC.1
MPSPAGARPRPWPRGAAPRATPWSSPTRGPPPPPSRPAAQLPRAQQCCSRAGRRVQRQWPVTRRRLREHRHPAGRCGGGGGNGRTRRSAHLQIVEQGGGPLSDWSAVEGAGAWESNKGARRGIMLSMPAIDAHNSSPGNQAISAGRPATALPVPHLAFGGQALVAAEVDAARVAQHDVADQMAPPLRAVFGTAVRTRAARHATQFGRRQPAARRNAAAGQFPALLSSTSSVCSG